jgi:hypothetical protein
MEVMSTVRESGDDPLVEVATITLRIAGGMTKVVEVSHERGTEQLVVRIDDGWLSVDEHTGGVGYGFSETHYV